MSLGVCHVVTLCVHVCVSATLVSAVKVMRCVQCFLVLYVMLVCSGMQMWMIIVVTAEDEGTDSVRVCIVLPGLVKKFASNKAKNAIVDVLFDTR